MQNLLILLFLLLLVLLLQSAWIASAQIRKLQPETLHLNHDTHHYFAVHFKDPSAIASSSSSSSSSLLWDEQPLSGMPVYELHKKALALADGMDGYELLGQIGELEGHYLYAVDRRIHRQSPPRQAWWWWRWRLTKRNSPNDHDIITLHKRALESRGADDIHWISHQQPRQRKRKRVPAESLPLTFDQLTDRLGMHDPELNAQWHLYNRAVPGADINITGVWAMNITGRGIVTAVIDDGLDIYHEDLKDNFYLNSSYDFNNKEKLPLNRLSDDVHGTRCAGEIAAATNSYCGVGIAYHSKVSGLRILSGPLTNTEEAMSLNYGYQENHLYSCSWGPEDDGTHIEGPSELVLNAFRNGVETGRGGLGTIYVFATGNGGYFNDNCNYDGYTNSVYTISIGAIDRNNKHPPYSEQCSAHLTVTYSSSSSGAPGIKTTDIRPRNCTINHGGTSAAAPIATGMLALALSARPDLGWRDLQHIIIRSSVPVTTDDPSWSETAAGRLYSHKYAYGRLDAYLLVQEAVRWNKVRRQVTFRSAVCDVSRPIPTELTGLNSTITISQQDVSNALLSRLEHVTVTVNIEHTHRGDLDIYLISPNGIVSAIGPHRLYDANANIMDWTFMSVKHWEEPPVGNWTLRVVDQYNPQHKGRLINWQLKLWGEAVAGGGTPTQTTRTRVQPTATAQPPTPTTNNASSGNWRSLVLIGLVLSALMGGLIWLAVWCRVYALPWKEWRRRWLSSAAAVGRNGTESKYSSLEMDMNELEKAFGEDEDETNSGKEVSGGNESPSALLRKTPQQNIYTIESE